MKRIAFVILFILIGTVLTTGLAQIPERKIIIEDGHYYYVTVDENFQVGTLYTGNLNNPLGEARALAMPAGRGISSQVNPLAWDLNHGDVYAISFLDHPLNDRNESIKKFELSGLQSWGTNVEVGDMIMQSVDQNMFVLNEPYLYIKKRSDYLNHFYFDAIVINDVYWMVMTNNEELTIWKYDGVQWEQSETSKFPVTGFFHLFSYKNELNLITQKGALYGVSIDGLKQKALSDNLFDLTSITLIEDRDNDRIHYIKNGHFNLDKSLKEIIQSSGIKLMSE